MKRLNRIEEKQIILKALEVDKFLGRGSSRAVYSLGDGTCLKIAFDSCGQFQNKTELDAFREYGKANFAEIYAFGRYVVVMEEVQVFGDLEELEYDFDNLGSRYEQEAEDYYNELEAMKALHSDYPHKSFMPFSEFERNFEIEGLNSANYYEIQELKYFLDGIFGYTSDNYQIGMRDNGTFVAYDYGFNVDDMHKSVSNKLWRVFNDFGKRDFLTHMAARFN